MNWTPPPGTAALIFDCDGTLADTMPLHYRAWVTMFATLGLPFPEARFYALGGMPTSKIVRLIAKEQGVDVSNEIVADFVAKKEALFVNTISEVKPVPAVYMSAQQHRGVMPMAVASGGYRAIVSGTLDVLACRDWFAAMVCAEDTVLHKPEPDVFLEAAARLMVPAAHCVVFEDTDLGLEAGRRAGMTTVDVRPWYESLITK